MCTHLDKTGSTYYFRRPVPKDLIGQFRTANGQPRAEWKYSLRTKDREEATRLLRPWQIKTDKLIDDTRAALANAVPQVPADLAEVEREREEQAALAELAAESAVRKAARSDLRTAWRRRRMTSTAELLPEQAAAVDLIRERDATIEQLRAALAVMEAGNAVLGITNGPREVTLPRRAGPALTGLFERYAATGTANPKTVVKWRARVADLVKFLGHDDPGRVTRADLNRWIEQLVSSGLAKKTITAGYVPPVRLTLAMAHDEGAIPNNPANALTVRAPKVPKLRERDLTDDEAEAILRAALASPPAKLDAKHALARRWVPWLCAYTGARVGDITQLRRMDIRLEQGIWAIHITPEAGSVKTNEARFVPIHPHLIEQGILDLAVEDDATPLFYTKGTGNPVNPASKMRASDLAKWVRSLGVTAPQPNHGWRHRFKTQTRAVGIPADIADRIQGHAPANEGGKYGQGPLAPLRDAVSLIPRYDVERAESDD